MFDKIKCPDCGAKTEQNLNVWQTHLVCDHCEFKFTVERITDSLMSVYRGWISKTTASKPITNFL